jgi:AraC family transcriptional regulator
MPVTARALWNIERNLGGDLTLASIAAASGVSPFHLSHAFAAVTGRPVMTYVRSRRLTEAARALARGDVDILPVALDARYASHEAFTRAFRDQFGVTPDAVRRVRSTSGLPLTAPLERAAPAVAPLDAPEIVTAGPIVAIGLAERQRIDSNHAIPGQWRRFMERYGEIEGRVRDIPIGLSYDIDEDGGFDYVCAIEAIAAAEPPAGLRRFVAPRRAWAVFRHVRHVSMIGETYRAIWNSWLTEHGRALADGPSLERHMETFDTRSGMGGVEIWIPLQDTLP